MFPLPYDLELYILSYLNFRELLQCTLVNRETRKTVLQSPALIYIIELARDGLIEAPPPSPSSSNNGTPPLSTSTKLQKLLERRKRWTHQTPLSLYHIPLSGSCNCYELVGGVFAKAKPNPRIPGVGSRIIDFVMLPDGERNGGIHRIEDLGVDIRDFAIDPGQDLLVLLESEHIIDELSWSRIYFRTMSGNKVHPRAARAKVAYTSPDFHGSEMQIASDVLSLTCSTSLVIWNWHTGIQETTLRMDDTMTDFDFITPRSFLITVRKHTGNVALNLYTFVSPSDGPTPTHIATLEISSLAPPLLSPFSTSHLSHPHINGGLPNGHANGNGAPNANGTAEAGAGRQTGGGLTWRSSITSHTGPYETMLPVEEGGSLFGVGREEAVHVIRLSFGVDPPTPPGGGGGHGHGPGQQGGGGGGGGIGIQGQAQVLPNGMGQIQIAAPGGDIQEFNAALAAVLAAVQQAQGLGQGQGGNVVEQVIGPQLVMGPPQPVLGGGGGGGGGAGVGYHVSFDIIIKNRTFMRIIREIEEERANSSLSPPPLSSSSSSSFYNLHAPLLSRTATPIRISTPNLSGTATPTTPGTPGHGHSHSSRSGGIRWDEHQTKIPAKILKWHEWAPRNTRIVNRGNQHHWLRFVHGSRVLGCTGPDEDRKDWVLDFGHSTSQPTSTSTSTSDASSSQNDGSDVVDSFDGDGDANGLNTREEKGKGRDMESRPEFESGLGVWNLEPGPTATMFERVFGIRTGADEESSTRNLNGDTKANGHAGQDNGVETERGWLQLGEPSGEYLAMNHLRHAGMGMDLGMLDSIPVGVDLPVDVVDGIGSGFVRSHLDAGEADDDDGDDGAVRGGGPSTISEFSSESDESDEDFRENVRRPRSSDQPGQILDSPPISPRASIPTLTPSPSSSRPNPSLIPSASTSSSSSHDPIPPTPSTSRAPNEQTVTSTSNGTTVNDWKSLLPSLPFVPRQLPDPIVPSSFSGCMIAQDRILSFDMDQDGDIRAIDVLAF